MAKAYDRMSWTFVIEVLKKFGFSDLWNDMVFNLISGVWYSVLINGSRAGFFTSSQGLKQGDPLSPSLFIIDAEVLTRSLNSLHANEKFVLFSMPTNAPLINHLAYVDDVIIFSSGNQKSIKLIMKEIRTNSGQQVNSNKSHFLTAPRTTTARINRLRACTGFMEKDLPFIYLGCPIYVRRKKIEHFDIMINKVVKMLNGWQGKMLSYDGRIILIKHVLQALPTYNLSALSPPKGTFKLLEKHFANFFCGSNGDTRKYYWSSWKNLCYPIEEGGISIRRMEDINETLAIKKWWRAHPATKKWASGDSHLWKSMTQARQKAEIHMIWQVNSVSSSFLWDNWKGKGPLATEFPEASKNGSYNANSGKAGLGRILRDDKGNLVMAFSHPTTCNSNIIAEEQAAKFGMQWCIQNGFKDFSLELDSTAVIQMINDKQADN
ncbi:PREDICTED: uncharacterized protein LOC109209747 [Nicotiana attenuata]|uniref:uncharacterized protein LOC109209747 n=1 Tax=Nicotiana attenuata TaxID=49451 RepID=UPI0009051F3D|nr:PREDICTED: uncharacterized protein LOC109209747 [Nicotiana attenuata]